MSLQQAYAGNECLLHARSQARYVAVVDTDEICITLNNKTLLDVLDDAVNKEPQSGAFVFRTSHASVSQHRWFSATNPDQITFDALGNVSLLGKVRPAGESSKLIVIPERVLAHGIHMTVSMEPNFTTKVIDPSIARILHLRLVPRPHSKEENIRPSSLMKKDVRSLNERYTHRITAAKRKILMSTEDLAVLKSRSWSNIGMKVMQQLDTCFWALDRDRGATCAAHIKCTDMLLLPRNEWVLAESKWTVL